MNTLVLYESLFGNTRKVAELIGEELKSQGPVRVANFADYDPSLLKGIDLLVIGGPTQAHGATKAMRQLLDEIEAEPKGIPAAAFDTRIKGAVWLTGAASQRIDAKLRSDGFKTVVEPESFIVTTTKPPQLAEGEAERAREWAGKLAAAVKAVRPAVPV